MAQGHIGHNLTELLKTLNFMRHWLGPGVVAVTRKDQQQLDLSSMESVMDQDTLPSQFVF